MKLNKQIISDLRKEYGDAFYLLDSKQFRSNYTELKNAFSSIYSNFNIAYSYKTNYTPKLCKIVNELGGYAEVVSEMEAELAMRIGVKENRIIWNGPIKIRERDNLYLINLQCHFAKRQLEYWPEKAKGMLDLIDRLNIVPQRIDLGGGLFGKMENSLKEQFTSNIPNYQDYANAVATLFAERFSDKDNQPELIIEPGSALVGDCMKFVGTVKTIKNIRGKSFATVLGSQKNISMTGVNPPIEIINMSNEQDEYKDLDFVGFTCIESDVIYRNFNGKLAINDAIVISNCGSYSLVMKPPFILPNFAVLDVSEGKTEVIKRAENFEDVFHTFEL